MRWSSGTQVLWVRLGHLIGQGARQLEISRDQSNVPNEWSGEIYHDGSTDRSSRRQEKVHRGHTVGRESGVRDARYGLRDVRVGEATHPGPQGRPRDTSHEVLDNLGRELRLMESDDEPLVRSMDGRNVVPRITSIVATEASERREMRCSQSGAR